MKLPYSNYLQPPGGGLLLYYITDRRQFSGNPQEQNRRLLDKIAECAAAGIDFIQLREKDLSIRNLEDLSRQAAALVPPQGPTRLLINSRIDVALACGAHGVHLPASDLSASEARAIFTQAASFHPIVAVSTHSLAEFSYAEAHGADLAVFGPVFEKDVKAVSGGLDKLREACRKPDRCIPVLALGGITADNAQQCLDAGANGIAAIRLFQENEVSKIAAQLNHKGHKGTQRDNS
jgi:thiamine-phosphate pyrophosphorylase